MKPLSNWRSVRALELGIERNLRWRHTLWLHGWCIGALVLGLMWLAAHLQLRLGPESLALRYLATLGVGYVGFLLILRLWAAALLHRGDASWGDVPADLPLPRFSKPEGLSASGRIDAGGGGDFGGGGASGDFIDVGGASSSAGELASGALEAAAGADEGAVVVVPVVAVFLIGMAIAFSAGSLVLLYFGSDVLLAVAVEVAFGYVSAHTAVRVARQGWLAAAVRLTWKPLFGALACAVVLGGGIDHFIPSAHSLPQAVHIIRSQH